MFRGVAEPCALSSSWSDIVLAVAFDASHARAAGYARGVVGAPVHVHALELDREASQWVAPLTRSRD